MMLIKCARIESTLLKENLLGKNDRKQAFCVIFLTSQEFNFASEGKKLLSQESNFANKGSNREIRFPRNFLPININDGDLLELL